MTRLKKITIKGFRGARFPLELDLTGRNLSIAIYGDNGGGKSTITDALEWFYSNRIDHLWREDCKEECLRNTHYPNDKDAVISVELSNKDLSALKTLSPLFRAKYSNNSDDFINYLQQSRKERLFFRYGDILRFIVLTKGDKRSEILNIIGYHAIEDIRGALVSACNDIERDSKFREVRNRLAVNESYLLKNIGQVIVEESDLYNTANHILKPLKLKINVVSNELFDQAVEAVKTQSGTEREKIEKSSKYSQFQTALESLKEEMRETEELDQFLTAYGDIIKDKQKIKKIGLSQLLEKGKEAIENEIMGVDICPLCLSTVDFSKVLKEIEGRVQELETIREELEDAKDKKTYALAKLRRIEATLSEVSKKRIEDDADHEKIADLVVTLGDSLQEFMTDLEAKFLETEPIEKDTQIFVDEFNAVKEEIDKLIPDTEAKKKALAETPEQRLRIETHEKITNLKRIFDENKRLSKELSIFEKQLDTLTKIRDEFVRTQSDVLQRVLQAISGDVDTFYRKINPEEGVENIRLDIIGEEGVEFKYVFHGKESHPPLKYLSESHLNCLGICLYLASVKLFNKENKFFILDDVITSFDKDHRIPFLRLLQDHFSDYQVLLFTHERFWYEIINAEMKQFGWLFNDVSWSVEDGIQLKKSIVDIKEWIEHKLDQGILDVGNDLRKLLEQILKQICFNLGAKLSFRFNDDNEQRMLGELLSALRGKLKNEKCDIRDNPIFGRLSTSSLVTSRTSHDSPPFESSGDIDQVRRDIEEFENLFLCAECQKYVSMEYADKAGKLVKCRCGKKYLSWAFV